jgi:predicted metal-binding membrane protein
MWSIMMVAMMLPSAAPTILLVSGLERNRGIGHGVPTAGVLPANSCHILRQNPIRS